MEETLMNMNRIWLAEGFGCVVLTHSADNGIYLCYMIHVSSMTPLLPESIGRWLAWKHDTLSVKIVRVR